MRRPGAENRSCGAGVAGAQEVEAAVAPGCEKGGDSETGGFQAGQTPATRRRVGERQGARKAGPISAWVGPGRRWLFRRPGNGVVATALVRRSGPLAGWRRRPEPGRW